jgi:hypothetical protein
MIGKRRIGIAKRTGEKADPEENKSVGSIRVRVDPETGEGFLVDVTMQ